MLAQGPEGQSCNRSGKKIAEETMEKDHESGLGERERSRYGILNLSVTGT